MAKNITRSLVTEILAVLYLIAFTQINGWLRWIVFVLFVENMLESIIGSVKSKGKQ